MGWGGVGVGVWGVGCGGGVGVGCGFITAFLGDLFAFSWSPESALNFEQVTNLYSIKK